MERLFSLFGMVVILAIAWALSTDRKAIRGRTVAWGLGLQLVLALFVLKTPIGQEVFAWVGAESAAVRSIRADLRSRWGLGRAQHHAIGYWRRGRAMSPAG